MPLTPFTNVTILTSPQIMLSTGSSSIDGANTIDLTGYANRIQISRTFDQHDVTVFGQTDHATALGLGKWQAQVELLQEYTSGGIDARLWPLVGSATAWFLMVRPSYGARSSSNPEYTGPVRLADYNPINGQIGDPLKNAVTLVGAGSLSRVASSS